MKKAIGIDGVIKEEYSKKLEENLNKLVERLKWKSYKSQPARRVEIEKDNGKTRPLSIYLQFLSFVRSRMRKSRTSGFCEGHTP